MPAKTFLIINGLVLLVILWRMFTGSRSQPTPLNVSNPKPPTDKTAPRVEVEFDTQPGFTDGAPTERSLNCMFQFNGQAFDAFEILGVPAGSSRETCLRALADLRRRKPNSDEFWRVLQAALDSQLPR